MSFTQVLGQFTRPAGTLAEHFHDPQPCRIGQRSQQPCQIRVNHDGNGRLSGKYCKRGG
jgi:hypothetical protein